MDLAAEPPKSPEEIFPLEVWGLILDKLESPSDMESCYQTCEAWAELLKPKRANFLMPKVFPILREYLLDDEDDEDEDGDGIDCDGSSDGEEQGKRIWNLRLVSRFWKESVDQDYQSDAKLIEAGFMEKDSTLGVFIEDGSYYFDKNNISKLESSVGKNFAVGSNPFINRCVIYNEDSYNVFNGHRERLLTKRLRSSFKILLESFGSEIWTCALTFLADGTLFHELLHSFLSLMPNLKYLRVDYNGQGEFCKKKKLSLSPKQFECLVRNKPFPKLEHLNMLKVLCLPAPLTAGLLSQNGHVGKLSIIDGEPEGNIPNVVVNVQSTELEQLALDEAMEVDFIQLKRVTWPLKSLYLSLGRGDSKLSTVFRTVPTFSSTLEYLVLDHCEDSEKNCELHELRLELPNLNKIKFHTQLKIKTIDFLLGCTALEEVELFIRIPSAGDKENDDVPQASVIQFKDCINSMEQSNIWQALPRLQVLEITTLGSGWKKQIYYQFTRRQNGKIIREEEVLLG